MINMFTPEELDQMGYMSKDDARERVLQADMTAYWMGRRVGCRHNLYAYVLAGIVVGLGLAYLLRGIL